MRNLKSVIGAVLIGLAIGICGSLGVINFLTTLRVASLVATAPPTVSETPTPLPTPTETATRLPTPTIMATAALMMPTPRVIPIFTRAPETPCPSTTPRSASAHFLFWRPLALDAPAPAPNSVYLYGTTELGQYEVHHGVDFDRNPIGVPVYAVGDGVVVSAGDDRNALCGDKGQTACGRVLGYYGLVVVIRLDQGYRGQTLFAQYGHMDRIDVRLGQRVKRGDVIGTVGMTGIALGPHVHFEIRVGTNDYASTRNPMLWIAPLPGRGVIAGRYADAQGNLISAAIIDIYRAEEPTKFYRETETYGRDEQPNVNSDDEPGENFLMNDLPAGDYIVRVMGKPFAARVTVEAGKLTFVEMGN